MQKNSFLKFLIINISIILTSSCSTVTQNQNVLFNPDIIEAQSQNNATPNIVLHWTHHSDNSKHPNGYIKLQGRTYQ